jgi:hypothetical protein
MTIQYQRATDNSVMVRVISVAGGAAGISYMYTVDAEV